MQPLKAGFLLIGNWDKNLEEWGAQISPNLSTAHLWIVKTDYDVIVLTITGVLEKQFSEFYEKIKSRHPATQFIISVPASFSPEKLVELHAKYGFFKILKDNLDSNLQQFLFAALEEANQRKQDENLAVLIREQTSALQNLQVDLENRVEKRTRYLTESRRKLFITNNRIEGLKKALIAVHQASSVSEMETTLVVALAPTVDTSWIRIFFTPQDELFEKQLKKELNFAQLKVSLFKNHEKTGSIFFMRPPDRSFSKDEGNFLQRVAETVSLALDRIYKLQEIEVIKEQWETTFSSMSEPVVLIDTNYDIIQTNGLVKNDKVHSKCYKALYNFDVPCTGCRRGQNFRMDLKNPSENKVYEVFSQSLLLDPQNPPVFVNQYHDISEQLVMEKQILESARLAELGTIGSSIAHELNNPLAGIISFTQLIKMDLPTSSPLYPDLIEMEKGALRCKEIIQNLLGFTRDPGSDLEREFELREVIHRALKIIELRTKSAGVQILGNFDTSNVQIKGHFNLLAQALKNIIQSSLDALFEKKRETLSLKNLVIIDIVEEPNLIRVFIRNTEQVKESVARNFSTPIGLALPVAQQILRDHNADLDFELTDHDLYQAKISFPRPVLGS